MTILIFEGPDKVGKSTLIKAVNKLSNYEFICIDRFLGSAWVYDKVFKRRQRQGSIIGLESELSKLVNTKLYVILLTCNLKILEGRIAQKDEFGSDRLKHIKETVEFYEEYKNAVCQLPVIEINTTNKSELESAREIIRKIKKI